MLLFHSLRDVSLEVFDVDLSLVCDVNVNTPVRHFFAFFLIYRLQSLPLEVPVTAVLQQLFIICRIKSLDKASLIMLPLQSNKKLG